METTKKDSDELRNKLNDLLDSIDPRLGARESHELNSKEEKKSPEKFLAMVDYFWLGWYGESHYGSDNSRYVKVMVLENGWVYVDYGDNDNSKNIPVRMKLGFIEDFFDRRRLELLKFLISDSKPKIFIEREKQELKEMLKKLMDKL